MVDHETKIHKPRAWFLSRQLLDPPDRWARPDDLADQDLERPVGLVNGAYDILHPGHLRLIAEARSRSSTLIAALDSDEKVRRSKGPERPVFWWTERAASLVYLGVDWVVEINEDEDFTELCRVVVPDFRVLSFEYVKHKSRVPWVKRIFVRDSGTHTTDILRRIHGRNTG